MSKFDTYFLMKTDDAIEYAKGKKFRRSNGMLTA